MSDTKTLLFVNDDEAKLRHFNDVVREQPMRADEHIDLAFTGRLGDRFLSLRRTSAKRRYRPLLGRPRTAFESLVMLVGEHRRRG